ncbi:3146_t:CDS:2, partial [Acaulospora morrowiae]
WAEEAPAAVSCLKIVYRGRLLDDDTTLESNKIPCGQSTVVHLAIKNVQDDGK